MNTSKFFCILFVMLSAAVMSATANEGWEKNPLVKRITDPEKLRELRALRQNVRDKGCDVNLCFALQADSFITDYEYQAQKDFIDLMVAILTTDEPGNYCAVQYGFTTYPISPLTGNKFHFLRKLNKARRIGGYYTNIAGALGYAGFQLRPRKEDVNQIILLGDGLESIGFRPKFVAKKILSEGTEICAVAIGGASYTALTEVVGGDPNKIVTIDGFFKLGEIIVGLVNDVCGYYK